MKKISMYPCIYVGYKFSPYPWWLRLRLIWLVLTGQAIPEITDLWDEYARLKNTYEMQKLR